MYVKLINLRTILIDHWSLVNFQWLIIYFYRLFCSYSYIYEYVYEYELDSILDTCQVKYIFNQKLFSLAQAILYQIHLSNNTTGNLYNKPRFLLAICTTCISWSSYCNVDVLCRRWLKLQEFQIWWKKFENAFFWWNNYNGVDITHKLWLTTDRLHETMMVSNDGILFLSCFNF